MDKNLYVKDIANGSDVSSLFLIKRSDLRSKRGEQFVHMTLADRTGTIECKAYGSKAVEAARAVKTDSLLAGPVTVMPGQETEFLFTPADIKGNAAEIQKVVASIGNSDLRLFVACCLDHRFYECPAAIRRHHEYLGGLCEHSLETVRIALNLVETMPRTEINRDMVIAGAVLHDIGKIFCFDKVGYGYVPNDTYNLIEHITMGIMFIDEYKSLISESQLLQLRHIIQSHHGIYGDVVPLTAEAWLVNQVPLEGCLISFSFSGTYGLHFPIKTIFP